MESLDSARGSQPGEIGFHGDRYLLRLVDWIAERVELFVETGANLGTTLGYVGRTYPRLGALSCEPDPAACATAREYLPRREGIELFEETSQDFLQRLERRPELHACPAMFWLDAHGYGFEWPLEDELRFISQRWRSGFVLIDDFKVPGRPEFGFDAYEDQVCAFEQVRAALAPSWRYRLYYPAYSEHTSPFHPLRGWGLLQFGTGPLARLDFVDELCGVLELARGEVPASTPKDAPRSLAGAYGLMARRDPWDDLVALAGGPSRRVVLVGDPSAADLGRLSRSAGESGAQGTSVSLVACGDLANDPRGLGDGLSLRSVDGLVGVLRDLGGRLGREVRALHLEVAFDPAVDPGRTFADLDPLLRGRGFELFNLYEFQHQPDGRLRTVEAVYVNTERVHLPT